MLALLVEIGELANETRCFKYWSNKPASEREVILEEYVDGLHFILSIGIDLGIDKNFLFYKCAQTNKTQVEIFLDTYAKVIRFTINHLLQTILNYLRAIFDLDKHLNLSKKRLKKHI